MLYPRMLRVPLSSLIGGACAYVSSSFVLKFSSSVPNEPVADTTAVGTKNHAFYKHVSAQGVPVLAPLAVQTEFDVAIVGSGIIGLATAREIQRRFPGLTVCVIEKEREVAPHQVCDPC
jgi:hypothetical protein